MDILIIVLVTIGALCCMALPYFMFFCNTNNDGDMWMGVVGWGGLAIGVMMIAISVLLHIFWGR